MSAVRYSTAEFERSHGTRPRGRGYWAFELTKRAEGLTWVTDTWWSNFNELYSLARKRAMARAQDLGYESVNLLP